MTNLEFIEKEIKKRIDNISTWEKLLKDDTNDKFSARCLNKYKEELEVLFKIKSELEAWYSIKQGIMICEDKVDEDSYYEYLQFDEELFDELESEEAGERLQPIKKALEVEE